MLLLKFHYKGITKAILYTLKLALQELMTLLLVDALDPVACWEVDSDIICTYSIPYYITLENSIYLIAVCLVDSLTPAPKFAFPYLMLIFLPSICLLHDTPTV